jgi:hypothetical protein
LDYQWWEKQILINSLELLVDPDSPEDDDNQKIHNFKDDIDVVGEPIEEYDGLNENFAYFVLVANLELLMRGHAIKIITQDKKINIDVPSLYNLTINLPIYFDKSGGKAYFDCKKRTLAIILPLEGLNQKPEDFEIVEEAEAAAPKQPEVNVSVTELSDNLTSDEMLFDLV